MPSTESLRTRARALLLEQRELVEGLLRLREQLKGSLFTRFAACGKAGCACRQGRKHGPYYVLSDRSGGRGSFAYLAHSQVPEARGLLAQSREFRGGLKRLAKVNQELVRALKRYQQATLREGGRRLRIPVTPSA